MSISANALNEESSAIHENAKDLRIYFWIPSEHVGFLQAVIDAEDNLARIRTERQQNERALILLMSDITREVEVRDCLRYIAQELEISLEFVDSIH